SSIAMQIPRNDGKTDPRNNVYLIVRSRKKIDKKSQILIYVLLRRIKLIYCSYFSTNLINFYKNINNLMSFNKA
uniref:hypothetical protein n=1 Tax=Rickettsia sp. Tenjiku01 TaxID=1736693 RepID=UPI000B185374